jgi:hypothetical protein
LDPSSLVPKKKDLAPTTRSTTVSSALPASIQDSFVISENIIIWKQNNNAISLSYEIQKNIMTNTDMKILYGSPVAFKVGPDSKRHVFYYLLRRKDLTGFNVMEISNQNRSIIYGTIRSLGNFVYEIYNESEKKSFGKISMYDDCLVRIFLQTVSRNNVNYLKINYGFYNLQGTMVNEYLTEFEIEEGANNSIVQSN